MKDRFIYVVGQPDLKSGTIDSIHNLGYSAGLLLDSQIKNNYDDAFDRVEVVDYSDLSSELPRLKNLDLSPAGFISTYENYTISKARISHLFNMHSLSEESARLCTDKSLMRQAFTEKAHEISPRFSIIDSAQSAAKFAEEYGYPVIIKPTGLVKSLLVMKCSDAKELAANVTYALESIDKLYGKYRVYDRAPEIIIEEYMTGQQFSIAAFVDETGSPHFCDGAVALTTAQNIGVDDNYLYKRLLPAEVDDKLMGSLLQVSELGVRALGMRSTPAHIELMNTKSGVKVIEIGARIGGYRPRMYKYSYGVDLVEQEVRLAIGKSPLTSGKFSQYCAVYEMFPKNEGKFAQVLGSSIKNSVAYYKEPYRKGNLVGPAKNGYKAAVIAIATDGSQAAFEEQCRELETLSVEVSS